MFDYGLSRNLRLYGQKKPPPYNLKNIAAPVALFYGKGDAIVAEEVWYVSKLKRLPWSDRLKSYSIQTFRELSISIHYKHEFFN